MSTTRGRTGGLLASLVTALAALAALVLALHIAFVLVQTNPGNPIVQFVQGLADNLAWVFDNLFLLENPRLQLIVDYGVPALIYLIVARAIAVPLRRLG